MNKLLQRFVLLALAFMALATHAPASQQADSSPTLESDLSAKADPSCDVASAVPMIQAHYPVKKLRLFGLILLLLQVIVQPPEVLAALAEGLPVHAFWAQGMVRTKAMQERVAAILAQNDEATPLVRIAVVDGGFLPEFDPYLSLSRPLAVKELRAEELGDEDEGRWVVPLPASYHQRAKTHGSRVTSLIVGKGHLGQIQSGVSLELYDAANLPVQKMIAALEHVCREQRDDEAVTLINLSMSLRDPSEPDEEISCHAKDRQLANPRRPVCLPSVRNEQAFARQFQRLATQGCLVVAASGNDDYQGPHRNQLDDAYLRVGSRNKLAQIAKKSSVAEVHAPGEDVFLPLPHHLATPPTALACGPAESPRSILCTPCSGTSYAAPIVTGIAAQVVKVLKSAPYFRRLSPADRVALVNHLLKESESRGIVDGLRAIDHVNAWNESF